MLRTPLPEERSLMDGEGNVDKSWDVGPKQHKGPVLDEHSCFLTDTSCGLGVLQEALPEQGRALFSWVC